MEISPRLPPPPPPCPPLMSSQREVLVTRDGPRRRAILTQSPGRTSGLPVAVDERPACVHRRALSAPPSPCLPPADPCSLRTCPFSRRSDLGSRRLSLLRLCCSEPDFGISTTSPRSRCWESSVWTGGGVTLSAAEGYHVHPSFANTVCQHLCSGSMRTQVLGCFG